MSYLGDVLGIDLTNLYVEKASVLKRITDGGLGAEPPAVGGYGVWGQSPPGLSVRGSGAP